MEDKVLIICPEDKEYAMEKRALHIFKTMTEFFEKEDIEYETAENREVLSDFINRGKLKHRKTIFFQYIDKGGINVEAVRMLRLINNETDKGRHVLEGSVCAILVDGQSELYTKNTGRNLGFSLNRAGSWLLGSPLIEATGSMNNFSIRSKLDHMSLFESYENSFINLLDRLLKFSAEKISKPNILAIDASVSKYSNTLSLWNKVKVHLQNKCVIREISLKNGTLADCRGCPHETCMHFSENNSCFYGGQVVKEVYPAILECDGLLLICPNYNDAVPANIAALINRCTALVKTNSFFGKRLFTIAVSGYSGGDIVAKQILGAMNMNKSFCLPPNFALLETANEPGDVEKIHNIEQKGMNFAKNILSAFQ